MFFSTLLVVQRGMCGKEGVCVGRGMCVEGVLWMGMCGEGYVWERGMCGKGVGKEYMFGPNVLCSLDCVSNGLSEGTVTLHGVYTNSDYPMHVLLAPNEAMKLS